MTPIQSLVAAALCAMATEHVAAADWVFAGSGVSGGGTVVAEIDRSSVRRQGQFAWVWVRYRVNQPTQVRPGVAIEIYEMHTRWDCRSQRGVASLVDRARAYSPSGRKLYDGSIEDLGPSYKFNTPMERAAALACGGNQ